MRSHRRRLHRRYGRATVKPAEHMKGTYKVSVGANELHCDGGKLLPYGATIGTISPRGTVKVWTPAASKPRGYKSAAKRLLEQERDSLRAQGLIDPDAGMRNKASSVNASSGSEAHFRAQDIFNAARKQADQHNGMTSAGVTARVQAYRRAAQAIQRYVAMAPTTETFIRNLNDWADRDEYRAAALKAEGH